MGIIADLVEYQNYADIEEESPFNAAIFALTYGFAQNFVNKSYMQGVRNAVDALSDGQNKLASFGRNFAKSWIPNVVGNTAVALDGDNTFRDARTITTALLSRLPGYSRELPFRRNIFGDAILRPGAAGDKLIKEVTKVDTLEAAWRAWFPYAHMDVEETEIGEELLRLNHNFSVQRPEKSGIDTRDVTLESGRNAYDFWLERTGTIQIGGLTAKEAVKALISAKGYKQVAAGLLPREDNPQIKMVNNVLSRYREAAWLDLMRTDRGLREGVLKQRQLILQAKLGILQRSTQ
jgi:hypothetical protein